MMINFLFTVSFVLTSSVLSNKITDRLFDSPQQIHLAAASRTSFRVSWKTKNITASVCSYGPAEHLLNSKVVGEDGIQYLKGHGYHHNVLLSNLPPDKSYFYQCGDGESKVNTSPIIAFNTAPAPTQKVNMAFLGDWGYLDSDARPMDLGGIGGLAKNWTATLTRELMETLKDQNAIDLAFILGDISYADDSFGHKRENLRMGYEPCYDDFMEWHQNVSSIMPLMVTPGNHESECHDPYCLLHLADTGLPLSNFSAYNTRFAMPSTESGGVLNMWYSFEWGPVHVTSINTETDFPGAGEEKTGDGHFPFLPAGGFAADGEYLAWVEKDLAKASTNPEVKWIVVCGHRPFEDLPTDNQQQLIALFKKYGVNMYFAGHGHTYIRYDQAAWGDNTIHIMPGASGNDETEFPADQFDPIPEGRSAAESCQAWCTSAAVVEVNKKLSDPCGHCINKEGVSPIFQTDKMSLGVLTATTTSLEWKLYRAPDGVLLDSISLTK